MGNREDIFHARIASCLPKWDCFPPIIFAVAIEVILCRKHETQKTWNTKVFQHQHEFYQMCWGSWLSVPSCFPEGLKATTSRETNYVVMCVVSQNQFWFVYCCFGGRPVYWESGSSLLFSISCTRVCSRFQLLRWFLTRDVNAYMNYTLRPAMQSYLTPSISHLDTNPSWNWWDGTFGAVQGMSVCVHTSVEL